MFRRFVFWYLSFDHFLKPNNVEHLFHWIAVQDILFQLRYQYISIRQIIKSNKIQ
jgi:hypothetical protein